MKREILFRGLRKDGQRWLYGDLIQWKSKGICAITPQEGDEWSNPYDFEVIPETVGQLIYVNNEGHGFYTGDIVSQYNHDSDTFSEGELVFNDLDMAWELKDTGVRFYKYHNPVAIGNIHEK